MGIFSGIDKATPSEGGVYLLPGQYVVEIVKCKSGTTRKKLDFFLSELRVLQSSNPERPVGSLCTWFVGIMPDTGALGNIKRFLAIANDVEDADVDDAGAEMAVSDTNPLAGTLLRADAVNVKTRAGGDFTRVSWAKFDGTQREADTLKQGARKVG